MMPASNTHKFIHPPEPLQIGDQWAPRLDGPWQRISDVLAHGPADYKGYWRRPVAPVAADGGAKPGAVNGCGPGPEVNFKGLYELEAAEHAKTREGLGEMTLSAGRNYDNFVKEINLRQSLEAQLAVATRWIECEREAFASTTEDYDDLLAERETQLIDALLEANSLLREKTA